MTKFKVVAVSENTNSFGLKEMVLLSISGATYTVCANSLRVRERGDIINIRGVFNDQERFVCHNWGGFELPTFKGKAPKEIIKEVWKTEKQENHNKRYGN